MTSVRRSERLHGMLAIVCAGTILSMLAVLPAALAQGPPPDGSRVLALVRLDGSTSGTGTVSGAGQRGRVLIEQKGTTQRFVVDAYGLSLAPDGGYGVFLGNSVETSNGVVFVNILSNVSSNGHWRVDLKSQNGAPAQLGVSNVNDLVGQYIFIADVNTNAELRTLITPLVPKPSALSYTSVVAMQRPAPAPSPHANGRLLVKYNGKTGASYLDVRGRRLAIGNEYCVYIVPVPGMSAGSCEEGENLSTGKGFLRFDTGKGEDLPYGLPLGVTTVEDLAGLYVEIRDVFGATHLSGQIQAPFPIP